MSSGPQTEFNDCPKCKVGKMKPTGGAATSNDPNTGRETGFYREYKCDNCGYPEGGYQKVAGVNEVIGANEGNNNQPPQQQPQQQPPNNANTTAGEKSGGDSNNSINPT
jgi:hypothetical protein